jgi:fructose-bisphosphate aldolase class II
VGIAKKFVKETGVDSLAINIGNIHGTYRGSKRLNINLLKDIHKKIPAFLVLHGGSATNQKDIKKAIKNGITKININTETRIVWRKSLEKSLRKDSIKPYEILTPVVEGVKQKIEQKIKLFSTK